MSRIHAIGFLFLSIGRWLINRLRPLNSLSVFESARRHAASNKQQGIVVYTFGISSSLRLREFSRPLNYFDGD